MRSKSADPSLVAPILKLSNSRLHPSVQSVQTFHVVLILGTGLLLPGEESLAVLVQSKGSDDAVGWVDGGLSLLAVGLLFDDLLNVNAPFSAVDFGNLALTVLVGSAHDLDGVSVANWDAANVVLLSELLRKVAGHQLSTDAGWGAEVSLSGFSSLGGHAYWKRDELATSQWTE